MQELEHPDTADVELSSVLFALSDPVRLTIVREVAGCPPPSALTCQDVALDMPKSTRSHHLKVLREAGVVRNTARGRDRVVTLRREDLDARFPGLLTAILSSASRPV